jgi:hypothetical protein
VWQVVALAAAAVGVLFATLHYAAPRAREARQSRAATAPGGGPRCYPMTDVERVKLMGRQNTAVHRAVKTASPGAQALFNLGLMHAWGFERGGAADNFEVGSGPCCSVQGGSHTPWRHALSAGGRRMQRVQGPAVTNGFTFVLLRPPSRQAALRYDSRCAMWVSTEGATSAATCPWGRQETSTISRFATTFQAPPPCYALLTPSAMPPPRCRWGLAYAAGPYPNIMTGPDNANFPVFGPSAARTAEVGAL